MQYLSCCNSIIMSQNSSYIYRINAYSETHKFYVERFQNIKEECLLLESFVDDREAYCRKKREYWHLALAHYYKHIKYCRKDKYEIEKTLQLIYKDKYFKKVKYEIRRTGSLDEKIESYLMGYYRHKLYPVCLGTVGFISKLKHVLMA